MGENEEEETAQANETARLTGKSNEDIYNTALPRALANIVPRGNENVNVNSFHNPYQESEGTGALPNSTYYPTLNEPIAVGNTSGSEIGSHTIYAPPGALVPLGMMDARDAAVHKAALQKQMEEADFMKRHTYQPTKLDSANPELSNSFYKFLDNEVAAARRRSGSKWKADLETNINFQQKNQAFQNIKQNYDNVVDNLAQYHHDKQQPGYVASEEADKNAEDIQNGTYFLHTNPSDPRAQEVVRNASLLHANMDLDKMVNTMLDKSMMGDYFTDKNGNTMTIKDAEGKEIPNPKYQPYEAGPGREEFKTVIKNSTYTEQRIHDMAVQIKNDNPYVHQSIPEIEANIRAKKDKKLEWIDKSYSTDYPERENKKDDYSNNPITNDVEISAGGQDKTAKTSYYVTKHRPAGATDQQVKNQVANKTDQTRINTNTPNEGGGNSLVSPEAVVVLPINKNTGLPFKTKDEFESLKNKVPYDYQVKIIANENPEPNSKQTTKQSFLQNPSDWEGKTKGKSEDNSFDNEIRKSKKEAAELNKHINEGVTVHQSANSESKLGKEIPKENTIVRHPANDGFIIEARKKYNY
jgi:hypothetical protein